MCEDSRRGSSHGEDRGLLSAHATPRETLTDTTTLLPPAQHASAQSMFPCFILHELTDGLLPPQTEEVKRTFQ